MKKCDGNLDTLRTHEASSFSGCQCSLSPLDKIFKQSAEAIDYGKATLRVVDSDEKESGK